MPNIDFSVLIKALLDTSTLPNDLQKIQNLINKDSLKIATKLDSSKTVEEIKKLSGTLSTTLNTSLQKVGMKVSTKDIQSALVSTFKESQREIIRTQNEVDKLNAKINNHSIKKQVQSTASSYNSLAVNQIPPSLNSDYNKLIQLSDKLNSSISSKEKLSTWKEMQTLLPSVQNQIKMITSDTTKLVSETQKINLANKMQSFYDKNTASHKLYGNDLKGYITQLTSGTNLTKAQLDQIQTGFNQIGISARQAGKLGKTFSQTIVDGAKKFSYWTSSTFVIMKAFQSIKTAITSVKALDTAMIDLQKTTNGTKQELVDFYYSSNDTAKSLGVTTQSIIDAASAWSRLGYSIQDAKTMAENSAIFDSISPDLDIDKATDGLVSVLKAFKIDADESLDGVISKINIIGNTQAVNNGDIVDFLTRSSAAMAEANNTLEESIALGTAGTEITRDAASLGQVLKTTSMRIRGYDEEVESYTDDLANLSGEIANFTKTASTPGGISLFTDDTKETYKSTYTILQDISKIWDDLNDKTQANLLEALAGKRNGQAIAAIISNFDAAEKSMASMTNSAGTAMDEMNIIYNSLDYKINNLSQTGVGIAQNLFDRDEMKSVIDVLTKFAEGLDYVTEKFGLFGTASLALGAVFGAKNLGKCV